MDRLYIECSFRVKNFVALITQSGQTQDIGMDDWGFCCSVSHPLMGRGVMAYYMPMTRYTNVTAL